MTELLFPQRQQSGKSPFYHSNPPPTAFGRVGERFPNGFK
jgi:hypothetical protein